MKNALYILVLAIAFLFAGCSVPSQPICSGTIVSGTVWEHPLSWTLNNSGSPIPKNTRVDVYEHIIVIHWADGSIQVVPIDFVSDLKLK
jgi:hypothetical protein